MFRQVVECMVQEEVEVLKEHQAHPQDIDLEQKLRKELRVLRGNNGKFTSV